MLAALRAEGGPLAQAVQASEQVEEAARQVEAAEHELDLYLSGELLSVIGQERFLQGLETRQRVLDEARVNLGALSAQSQLAEELTSGDLLEAWPTLTIAEKRRLLHGLLDRVVVTRSDGRSKDALPVDERVQIVLRGNVLLGSTADD